MELSILAPLPANPSAPKTPCMIMLLRVYLYSKTESNVKLTVPRCYHGTQFNNLVELYMNFTYNSISGHYT